jgi:hypothetical protein
VELKRNYYKMLVGTREKKSNFGDLDVDGRILTTRMDFTEIGREDTGDYPTTRRIGHGIINEGISEKFNLRTEVQDTGVPSLNCRDT